MFNALTTKQKYLHTVDSPSFCIVLNSPDDSLFFNLFPDTSLPPVIALSQLGHKKNPRTQEGYYPKCDLFYSQKRTSPSREADTLTWLLIKIFKYGMFNALSRLCLKAIVFSLQVLLPLAQFVGFDVHLSPPTIQV